MNTFLSENNNLVQNKKIYLLDPALSVKGGHNLDNVCKIANQFLKYGYNVSVLSNKNIREKDIIIQLENQNIQVLPTFQVSPYDPQLTDDNLNNYLKALATTLKDLEEFKKNNSHSILSIWLKSTSIIHMIANLLSKFSEKNIFLCGLDPRNFNNSSIKLYKHFSNLFFEKDHVNYLVSDHYTEKVIKSFINIKTSRFPDISDSYENKKVDTVRKKSIGIFGVEEFYNQEYLNDTINLCTKLNLKVYLQDKKNILKDKIYIDKKVRFFKFENNISGLFNKIDFGVYYFNPLRYKLMGSGLVNEAISYGLPIIIPNSNLPNLLTKEYSCEYSFDWQKKEELFRNIIFISKNHQLVSKKVFLSSIEWNKREGVDLLVKKIIETYL